VAWLQQTNAVIQYSSDLSNSDKKVFRTEVPYIGAKHLRNPYLEVRNNESAKQNTGTHALRTPVSLLQTLNKGKPRKPSPVWEKWPSGKVNCVGVCKIWSERYDLVCKKQHSKKTRGGCVRGGKELRLVSLQREFTIRNEKRILIFHGQ
jgi:hypothetical protein